MRAEPGMNRVVSRPVAILFLLIATVFWGSTFSFTKTLTGFFDPITLLLVRFTLATLVLGLIFARGILAFWRATDARTLGELVILGGLNFAGLWLQTAGLAEITASNSGFITSLSILFVPFIAWFLQRERVGGHLRAAVAIALAGIWLMSYGLALPQRFVRGDFLTFLCALVYAVYIVMVDRLAKRVESGTLMFFMFLVTALLALPFQWHSGAPWLPAAFLHPAPLFQMGFLVLLGSVVSYILLGIGQRAVDATTAALVYSLEPLFAMAIAVVFFTEPLSAMKIIGGAIVLAAQFVGLQRPKAA